MILSKLPKDIQAKIKRNTDKIMAFTSSELLDYSRALKIQKRDIGENIYKHLLGAIDNRRVFLNKNSVSISKTKEETMVNEFLKKRNNVL